MIPRSSAPIKRLPISKVSVAQSGFLSTVLPHNRERYGAVGSHDPTVSADACLLSITSTCYTRSGGFERPCAKLYASVKPLLDDGSRTRHGLARRLFPSVLRHFLKGDSLSAKWRFADRKKAAAQTSLELKWNKIFLPS